MSTQGVTLGCVLLIFKGSLTFSTKYCGREDSQVRHPVIAKSIQHAYNSVLNRLLDSEIG